MAVAYDLITQATNSTGTNITWNHTTSITPQGVLVITFVNADADDATAVTYGGVTVNAVSGGRALSTGFGDCKTWFLGSGIPSGTQSVVVTRTNNANTIYAVAVSFTAASNTSVAGVTLNTTTGNSLSETTITGAAGCLCVGATNAEYADINAAFKIISNNILRGTNSLWMNNATNNSGSSPGTAGKEGIYDFGSRSCGVVKRNTTGSGLVGFSASSTLVPSGSRQASVYLAVQESGTVTPLQYFPMDLVGVPMAPILTPSDLAIHRAGILNPFFAPQNLPL